MTINKLFQKVTTLLLQDKGSSEGDLKEYLYSYLAGEESTPKPQFSKFDKLFSRLVELSERELNRAGHREQVDSIESAEQLSHLFFPENSLKIDEESVAKVRELRRVELTQVNSTPLADPVNEVLFTANVLLTLPKDITALPEEIGSRIDMAEEQRYWYDHPIPLDIDDSSNEIIYGIRHFNETVKMESQSKATLILSVSCTHPSLRQIAREYLKRKLASIETEALTIYAFTEEDTETLLEALFKENLLDSKREGEWKDLKSTFGVDGKYGRHYTFLKAIAPLFQIVDPNLKATFKIDLDQVFPQEQVKEVTGSYSLEKMKNYRWGARGIDRDNRKVVLGGFAGTLVNEKDIAKSIYEPDVPAPSEGTATPLEQIFNSLRPQYLSTLAELGTCYNSDSDCIIRYHITGGMNGMLIRDLLRYRPFTPRFIARAEDQAFILSVLEKEIDGEYLRYYHQDHFVMRHDKEAFLTDDLERYKIPKMAGDYERMLILTHYVKDILNCFEYAKEQMQPFTSCFMSEIPCTVTLFRTLLQAVEFAETSEEKAQLFLENILLKVNPALDKIASGEYQREFNSDQQGWNCYYDLIEKSTLKREALEKTVELFKC